MGKFAKYRIHFNVGLNNGLLNAHSDPISPDEVEEYQETFGCGIGALHHGTGKTHWHADTHGRDENSRRLAEEWLIELAHVYPNKAKVVLGMLNETYKNRQNQPTPIK